MAGLSSVGRTLLSDTFEFDFAPGNVKHETKQVNGSGQALP
jgi:hypothetical protein